jgi:glycosyltransferase involved in cell wall biosynthesis
MERARAFVYAAEEDFGIVPVEAQACGTPVIAYGRGGVCETVVPGRTGILYPEQTVSSLSAALLQFEETADQFDPEIIRAQAERFDIPVFRERFSNLVQASYTDFVEGTRPVLSEHSAQSLAPVSIS